MSAMGALERGCRLTESQRALATKHLPLARSISKPIKGTFPWIADEIEGTVLQALVESAAKYDSDRPVTFRAYARHRMIGALRDLLRRELPLGLRNRRDESRPPRVVPFGRERTEAVGRVLNVTPEPPVGWELELAEALDRRLRCLPRRHADVCRLIYLHGHNQTEVAEILNITDGRVSRLHSQALAMLADEIRDDAESARNRRPRNPADLAVQTSFD